MSDGQPKADAAPYDGLRRRSRPLGFEYIPNGELLALSQDKRLERLEALIAKGLTDDAPAREAVLGTAPKPSQPLSRLFEEYEITIRDELRDMSPDQMRIWRNSRTRAALQFGEVVGDKEVASLTHNDMVARAGHGRRGHREDREQGPWPSQPDGRRMLISFSRLNLPDIFEGLHLRNETEKSRLPYDPAFIQTRFLGGALAELNEDARFCLYVMP